MTLLEENVPDPEVSNLIYWNDEELTAEKIVDKALSYKPIQLWIRNHLLMWRIKGISEGF
jgi:hypothetical protein